MPKKTAKHPAKPKRGKKLEIEEPGVLYGRYSSHNQKDISVEQQFEKGYELAAEYGIRIIDTYADRAVSGRTDKRKDFQRMMSEAAKGKFRYVIAWKSNRMGRNMLEALINEARLQELGVRVLYVEEVQPHGTEHDAGNGERIPPDGLRHKSLLCRGRF